LDKEVRFRKNNKRNKCTPCPIALKNVTTLARLEELYKSEKEARQALENEINKRAEFFRALVHELKTPLTPIVASSETLMEFVEDNTLRDLARNVYEGALRLNSRVDELLDISRGELGMLTVHPEPINITLLIQDVESYVRPQIVQNHQFLTVEMPNSIPVIMGDEPRLRQVLLNLLNNAMKFTPKDGKITVKTRVEESYLRIEVHDTGRGIDESEMERLFHPYNRIEDDRQHFSGLGLGLALCKKLIDLHGGRIWIESQKGKGTVFIFTLAINKPPFSLTTKKSPVKST
jgi:signal transduction histidine kinase